MSIKYPFCSNSRRWIIVFFYLNLPETCVAKIEGNVDCENEKCPYFEWRYPTKYILRKEKIMKLYEMDIFAEKKKI